MTFCRRDPCISRVSLRFGDRQYVKSCFPVIYLYLPAGMVSAADTKGITMQKLSTGPFSGSKKSGTKREGSPCTPYKRKARGKENNPGALSTGLFAGAGAGAREVERIRRREVLLKRHVEAAVEDALVAFCGKRRNPLFDREPWKDPCDERLWANFV